ncbi:MAG: serine/threonine-protein kinase [Pseudomonadota bacterium]
MTTTSEALEGAALQLLERAFDIASDERRAFIEREAGEDEALKARALALLDTDASPDSEKITGAGVALASAALDAHPSRVGSYRLTRLIGRGGMGAVYLGERDLGDFDHQAAVKLVTRGRSETKLAERLRAERRTLARLKHPGVAQLYDGGETDDGVPYFVMEYVEGEPLGEWLAAKTPSLEERLGVFRGTCAAVQYAHQNLVIHRDLSPSNILVSDSGAAKVIDFGISQTLGADTSDEGPRRTATRGYVAPERMQGEDATTLGDIYALGRILNDLLQGVPPNDDLAAIAARASAEDPEDRYTSVGALLDDLDRERAGLPVIARDGGSWYAVTKFVRRRRVAVSAGALAAAALFGALIVFATLFVRAERAEAEATARFEDVRNLARVMIFDVYQEITPLKGSTRARQTVTEAAQTYLGKLADDARASPELILEAAQGYAELGRVLGSPDGAALRQPEAALENLSKAIVLLTQIDGEPSAEVLLALGKTHLQIARLQIEALDNKVAAGEAIDAAERDLRRGLDAFPDDFALALALLDARGERATLLYRDDNQSAARELSRDVITEAEALRDQSPSDPRTHELLARARTRLALSLLNGIDTRSEAPPIYKQALEDIQRAYDLSDEDNTLNTERAGAFRRYANSLYLNERHDEAVAAFEQATKIIDEIAAGDPLNENAALSRIIFRGEMTAPLSSLGRFEEAEALLFEARDWYRNEAAAAPEDPVKQRRVWVHLYFMASHYRVREMPEESCGYIRDMDRQTKDMRAAGTLQELDAGNWQIVRNEYATCFE